MTTIGIYGASDDLTTIELDGKPWDELGEEEDLMFTAAGKTLHVHVEHGKRGWSIATSIDDETEEGDLPFKVALVQHHYSPKLLVTVGEEPVTFIWNGRDDDDEKIPQTKTFRAAQTGSVGQP